MSARCQYDNAFLQTQCNGLPCTQFQLRSEEYLPLLSQKELCLDWSRLLNLKSLLCCHEKQQHPGFFQHLEYRRLEDDFAVEDGWDSPQLQAQHIQHTLKTMLH